MPDTPKPSNVIEAIAAVIAEMPSVGKERNMSSPSGSYKYRGIEDMTGAAGPLLGKHGVVIVPKVESVEIKDVTLNSKPWTRTELMVSYRIFGPGPSADISEISAGPFLAIALDNSDKGSNKAMTQAYKQLLLQILCISDSKDDPDESSPQADTAAKQDDIGKHVLNQTTPRTRRPPPKLPSQAARSKPTEQVIEDAFPGAEPEPPADIASDDELAAIRQQAKALSERRPDLAAILAGKLNEKNIDLRQPVDLVTRQMVSGWLADAIRTEREEEPF